MWRRFVCAPSHPGAQAGSLRYTRVFRGAKEPPVGVQPAICSVQPAICSVQPANCSAYTARCTAYTASCRLHPVVYRPDTAGCTVHPVVYQPGHSRMHGAEAEMQAASGCVSARTQPDARCRSGDAGCIRLCTTRTQPDARCRSRDAARRCRDARRRGPVAGRSRPVAGRTHLFARRRRQEPARAGADDRRFCGPFTTLLRVSHRSRPIAKSRSDF